MRTIVITDVHGQLDKIPDDLLNMKDYRIIFLGDLPAQRGNKVMEGDLGIVKAYYGVVNKQGAVQNGWASCEEAFDALVVALKKICGDQYANVAKYVTYEFIRKSIHNGAYFSFISSLSANLRKWIIKDARASMKALFEKMDKVLVGAKEVIITAGNAECGSILGSLATEESVSISTHRLRDPILASFHRGIKERGWTFVKDNFKYLEDIDAVVVGHGLLKAMGFFATYGLEKAKTVLCHYPPTMTDEQRVEHGLSCPNLETQKFGKIVSYVLEENKHCERLVCGHLHPDKELKLDYGDTDVRILYPGQVFSIENA